MRHHWMIPALVVAILTAGASRAPAQPRTNVAVFNFQMKSRTPDWTWLEKGLADQITTDFIRSGGGLTVLARDDMQSAADKVKWTPELLSDERGMVELRKSLTVEQLVTGVYTVQGEQIAITAQVVQVSTREVKDRQEVAGKAADVLELQRQLSAKLVGYFTGKAADKVLPELPVWTKSIPATKAMYEGINLYDQGRYGEAWLKFRQASRDDGDYLEAQYWVGRMYYFMDRYEHARRAFERFVYMGQDHPRMGDAIKEYIFTYEKLGTPPEVMLALYRDFEKRYPRVGIYSELGGPGPIPNRVWLWVRQAQVLDQMGRLEESIPLSAKAVQQLPAPYYWPTSELATQDERFHNLLTGQVLLPPGPDRFRFPKWTLFQEGQKEAQIPAGGFGLGAPDGHIFKSLRFRPTAGGAQVPLSVRLWNMRIGDVPPDGNASEGAGEGQAGAVSFSHFPRVGIIKGFLNGGPARVVAEFEKVGPHGTIFPLCNNTVDYFVEVVGVSDHVHGWLVGLLPPAEHTVRFVPNHLGVTFLPWETKVKIEANKVTRLDVNLPWDPNSPWRSWKFSPTEFAPLSAGLYENDSPPVFQMDDKAIRFVQLAFGDIWASVSTDGQTFSKPTKIPMPVSSGWEEACPVCIRDESGRFLLGFASDRGAQREMRAYVCWSRDFIHWSAPVMVLDRPVRGLALMQDDKGRFLCAHLSGRQVTLEQSRDAYRWEKLADLQFDGDVLHAAMLQKPDGRYELFVSHAGNQGGCLDRFLSKDGAAWEAAGRIAGGHGAQRMQLSAMQVDRRSVVSVLSFDARNNYQDYFQLYREKADGAWEATPRFEGLIAYSGAMAYHPRWGYYIGWRRSEGSLNIPGLPAGDRRTILHGAGVDDLFKGAEAYVPSPVPMPPSARAGR